MINISAEDHKKTFYNQENKHIFEKMSNEVQQSRYLPQQHIYPKAGLMNDPNGLAYFNGKYYVFFQWYPFAPTHGLKHWGKTTSTDLLNWSEQEFALIPDQEHERNGCYSGNAIEHNGKLYLFYTANYKTPTGKIPKQALAIMDKDERIEKLVEPIIPEGQAGLSGELRDPYVFRRNDTFYMLLGGSQFSGESHAGFGDKGVLLLYQSSNLFDWEYVGLIDVPINTGYMLECPSLIEVDGKDVLFLSPMGIQPEGERFNNRFATIYLVGQLNLEKMCFELDYWDEMDAGFDFYAPQAFLGKGRNPMLFGWFGCGEQIYPGSEKWKHGLTLPQQMFIDQGVFKRYPAAEILKAFTEKQEVAGSKIDLPAKTYTLELTAGFDFAVGSIDDCWTFTYDQESGIASISREGLANQIDMACGFVRSTKLKQLRAIDVFVDNSFVEIYLNKGEKVFSFVVFQKQPDMIRSLEEDFQGTLAYEK